MKIIKNTINFTTEETLVVFNAKLWRKTAMANNKKSGQVPLSTSPGEPSPTLPARRNFHWHMGPFGLASFIFFKLLDKVGYELKTVLFNELIAQGEVFWGKPIYHSTIQCIVP